MNNFFKTTADEKKSETQKRAFFTALWVFNAVTSMFFGFQHIYVLFLPFSRVFPVEPLTAEVLARAAGAFGALIVLDAAYLFWEYLRINNAKSAGQVMNARLGETLSFSLSVGFTLAVLAELLVFPYVSESFRNFISWGSSGLFALMAAAHLVLMRSYRLNAPNVKEAEIMAETFGKAETERIEYQRQVLEKGILEAKKYMGQFTEETARSFGEQWGQAAVAKARGDLPAHAPKQLPPPPADDTRENYRVIPAGPPLRAAGLAINRRANDATEGGQAAAPGNKSERPNPGKN